MIRRQSSANIFTLIIMVNLFSSYQLLNALPQPLQPYIQLPQRDESHLTTPTSFAEFTCTSHDADHPILTTEELASMYSNNNPSAPLHIDDSFHNELDSRHFNNAYIKVNQDLNVDMRMTGSTTLLGKVTLPYTQKKLFYRNSYYYW